MSLFPTLQWLGTLRISFITMLLILVVENNAQGGGSWGNQVGGSLKNYDLTIKFRSFLSSRDFVSAEFYRVFKPAGLGVEHEYIGIRTVWRKRNQSEKIMYFTTGLVASGDEAFFKASLLNGTSTVSKIALIEEHDRFESIVKRMNKHMYEHPANISCRFTFRMVATPITGQPCTNAVLELMQLI